MRISRTFHKTFTHLRDDTRMTKSKSLSTFGTIALAILLPIFVAATWFGRGIYDKMFMLEGQVVVVNATAENQKIEFTFPSGEGMEFDLKAGASSQTVVGKTGEGSVDVTINGTRRDEVGYVTSMNGMIILTIDEDSVIFSSASL